MSKRIFTLEEKVRMAESYLTFKTFRNTAAHTQWDKSTIHFAVTKFIEEGGFYDVGSLKELILKNKAERSIRGGLATARKWKESKK